MPRRKLGYHCAAALLCLGKLIAASEQFSSSPEGLTSSDGVSSAQFAFEEPFLSANCGDKVSQSFQFYRGDPQESYSLPAQLMQLHATMKQ